MYIKIWAISTLLTFFLLEYPSAVFYWIFSRWHLISLPTLSYVMSDCVPGHYLGQKIKQWMGFQLWLQKKVEINLLIASIKLIFRAFQVANQYWFPVVSGGCLKENVVGMTSWSTLLMRVCMSSRADSLWPCGLQPTSLLSLRDFPRQEYWSGLPFPPSEDLPKPAIEPLSLASSALAGGFFTTDQLGKPTREAHSSDRHLFSPQNNSQPSLSPTDYILHD